MTTDEDGYGGSHARRANRCQCKTPVGTQCTADASQEDRLCDRCRIGQGKGFGGQHWCDSSSTPTPYGHPSSSGRGAEVEQ